MTTALIDADIVAFRAASKAQDKFDGEVISDPRVAIREAEHILEQWTKYVKPNTTILCFSCPTRVYFRHDIYPNYKGNRDPSKRPPALSAVIAHLKGKCKFVTYPGLEADDVMGILGTSPTISDPVIISIDKDMLTVPTKFLNPDKMRRPVRIGVGVADLLIFKQAMTGDSTDNYKGIPGTGAVKAEKIINEARASNIWGAVQQAFLDNGLTTEYAITMMRLARILRAEDYNIKTGEIRLWHPEKPVWTTPSALTTTSSTPSKSTTSSNKSAEISPETKPSPLLPSSSTSAAIDAKTTVSPPQSTSGKVGGISPGSSRLSKQKKEPANEKA